MLGSVVDTECWEAAREAAASQGKNLSKQAATAEGVVSTLESALQRLQLDLVHKQQQERDWQQQQQAEKVCLRRGLFLAIGLDLCLQACSCQGACGPRFAIRCV